MMRAQRGDCGDFRIRVVKFLLVVSRSDQGIAASGFLRSKKIPKSQKEGVSLARSAFRLYDRDLGRSIGFQQIYF